MRALVVDDTTFMRMTIKRILENHQIEVVGEAENGIEAIKKYKLVQPDLVIMDISMPLMDGIEAVKRIRAYDDTANIIICSLQGQRACVMEAIRAGAKSYLIKPIRDDKLMQEIAKLPLLAIQRNQSARMQRTVTEEDVNKQLQEEFGDEILINIKDKCEHSPEYIQGLEEGYLQARREIAINMVKIGISIEDVCNSVEIEREEVEKFMRDYRVNI